MRKPLKKPKTIAPDLSALENKPSSTHAVTVRKLLRWFEKNARDLPWRRTRDPYAIWISEIMLQQTQVKTVIPYWLRWMQQLPDIHALASAPPESILKLWEGLGYYRRAANLQRAAEIILSEHGGVFPPQFEDILSLPGIGRYTAGAISSIAFHQPAPILDGNVTRVLARSYGIQENLKKPRSNQRLWQLSEQLVREAHALNPGSPANCSLFNQALMELGAIVCAPRQPLCNECPLQEICFASAHNLTDRIPRPIERPGSRPRHYIGVVVERKGRYFVRQRPANGVNGHLWEFPNDEVSQRNIDRKRTAQNLLGPLPLEVKPLCEVRHTITRFRITLSMFMAVLKPESEIKGRGRWCSLAALRELPFTAAHKKILAKLPFANSD